MGRAESVVCCFDQDREKHQEQGEQESEAVHEVFVLHCYLPSAFESASSISCALCEVSA